MPRTRPRRFLWSEKKKLLMTFISLQCCFWGNPGCHSCQDGLTPVWCGAGLNSRFLSGAWETVCFQAAFRPDALLMLQAMTRLWAHHARHDRPPSLWCWEWVRSVAQWGNHFKMAADFFSIQLLLNCTSQGGSILSVLICVGWFSGKFCENL